MSAVLTEPELTLPEAEAELLTAHYGRAETILEYGSGGSTVLASRLAGKHIISVESSKRWWRMMTAWFDENPGVAGTRVDMIYADIGPTVDWGHPKDDRAWRRFAKYPLAVWDMEDFLHPDVVLVDGRFRIGCALATAFRITRPTVLLVDDYLRRKVMHTIADFLGAPQMTGRMAEFQLTPQAIPADRLLDIIKYMQRP